MPKAHRLPSGRWNVVICTGKDADGKRKSKSFTAETRKEAEFMAASYRMSSKEAHKTSNLTLKDAYTRYIDSKTNVFSPATVREYKRLQKSSLAGIMPLKLEQLTQEKIQIAINEESAGHSPKSVRDMHGLLSAVLSAYLPNFRLNTRLPQKVEPDTYVPTEDEVKKLLKAAEGRAIENAILLASVGTLRRSEISALTTEDIFDNGVTVNKAMVLNDKKEWVIKVTKSTAGKRFVELPPEIINKLRTREGNVVPLKPGTITNQFALLTKEVLGNTFRFHDLRHYAASVLHAINVPDAYIMRRGGWKSRDTLQRVYTHVLSDEEKHINETIMDHYKNGLLEKIQNGKQNESK